MIEELEDPTFMQWKMLPAEHVKAVIKQITKELDQGHGQLIRWPIISFSKMLRAHRIYNTEDYTYKKDQLLRFMQKQDSHRRIQLTDYIPQLEDFLR